MHHGGSARRPDAGELEAAVIVPCHNATKTLGLQLEALARQVGPTFFEVLVVDNRSTDGLRALVNSWRDDLPALRLLDAHARPGAGYARNVGAREARASKLLFCDADDLIAPDWVRFGSCALDDVPLACGSDITMDDDAFDSVDTVWAHRLPPLAEGTAVRARSDPVAYPIVLGGNLAVRRATFIGLGGFDASMRLGNEDNDFAVRAQAGGIMINRAPAMRLAIRERGSCREMFRRARTAGRGHIQLCDRHGLRDASPHLRGEAWRADILRTLAAGARMTTRPAIERDWPAIAARLGAAVGLWQGDLGGRIRRRDVPCIGAGLDGTE